MWLAGLVIMSALFVSCSPAGLSNVYALVLDNGDAGALVVEYSASIEKASATAEKYTVPGETVAKVFVSDVNPFKKSEVKANSSGNGGHFVVVLLKDNGEAKPAPEKEEVDIIPELPDVRIRQSGDLKTVDGKTIKAWRKAVKAKEGFRIPGGRIR